MFATIERVPGDAILGLLDLYRADENPEKVDLGVGVYRDESGLTPVLKSVKTAEKWLLEHQISKTYTGTHGNALFNERITQLVFGDLQAKALAERISSSTAPGGSGSLRLGAEFIHSQLPNSQIWLPLPTWSNHFGIFKAAKVPLNTYPYINQDNQLDFEHMLHFLKENVHFGDVLLLHACCHNPSGFDLNLSQWQQVSDLCREKGLLPFIDAAYQGFGESIDGDMAGLRLLATQVDEMIISSSCSKNFGIYNERTACLLILAASAEQRDNLHTQVASIARTIYSVPPNHGAAIVAHILSHEELAAVWRAEVDAMRTRIIRLRKDFSQALLRNHTGDRFDCVTQQRGMFSFTGLTPEQVLRLQKEFSIYMLKNGRANIAGMQEHQIEYVAQAIASLL